MDVAAKIFPTELGERERVLTKLLTYGESVINRCLIVVALDIPVKPIEPLSADRLVNRWKCLERKSGREKEKEGELVRWMRQTD